MFTTISTLVSLKNKMRNIEPVEAINATTTTPYIGSNLYNYFIFNQSGSITFTNPVNVSLQILCIAGGGGGGSGSPGGGGAGGMLQNTTYVLNQTNTLNIVVGNGGTTNVAGSNSSVLGNSLAVTAFGGGYGGANGPGGPGGSGGGGGSSSVSTAQRAGGAGTSGQGYNGGNGYYALSTNKSGGGGGGAGGPGGNGITGGAAGNGAGGVGKTPSLLTGLPSTLLNTVYAKGGMVGSGPGAANTGNGGGSANSGGSGIVIILYK